MRQIEFQEVGMENYGLYVSPMVLTFTNNKLILITGPNGIGKTMALDAIPFTLFGITSKGAKGDDVVNNTVGKNCKTWVKLKINSDVYEVTRFHKHSKQGSTVYLKRNGVDIKKGQREVLTEVERIICPRKTFMNTLMFGQKVKDFFTDLGDADKKEIFRRILDLDAYTLYYDETKKMLDKLEINRGEIDRKIAVTDGILKETERQNFILLKQKEEFEVKKIDHIQTIKKSIDDNLRLLEKWQQTFEEVKDQVIDITEIEKKLAQTQASISELKRFELSCKNDLNERKNKKVSEIKEKANEAIQTRRETLQEKITELRDQVQKIKDSFTEVTRAIDQEQNKIQIKYAELRSEKASIQNQIKEITEKVLEADIAACPLCKQDVTEDVKVILTKKIEEYKTRLKHISEVEENELKKIEIELTNQTKEKGKVYTENINELNTVIQKEQAEAKVDEEGIKSKLMTTLKLVDDYAREEDNALIIRCRENTEILDQDLLEYKKQLNFQNEVKNKLNTVEKTITTINNQNKVYEAEIQTIEKQEFDMRPLNANRSKVIEMGHHLEQGAVALKELGKMQDVVEFWKSGFSSTGIPSMLIDEAVPFMNQRVAHYLELITNGRYIVSFDTMAETKSGEFRDKISVRVIDTHTRANSRVQLSGGQTRIIDIATILTLGDLQSSIQDVKFNILLFDEIFDSLDEENIGYVSKVLGKLKIGRSIYIISHTHQEQVEADEVLAFR